MKPRIIFVHGNSTEHPPEDFLSDKPRSIYKATPMKAWINKGGKVSGYFVDERTEMDLETLRQAALSNS